MRKRIINFVTFAHILKRYRLRRGVLSDTLIGCRFPAVNTTVNETWGVLVSGSIMTSFGWMTETGGQWGLLKYTPGSLFRSDPRSTHLFYIFNSAQQIRSKPELTHEEILSHLTEHMWPAVGFKGFSLASCHACKKSRFPLLFHLRQVIERTLYVAAFRSDIIPFSRCKPHLYRFGLFR